MERKIIWVVISTNSLKEADKIGRICLQARLCVCYGVIPRIKSVYRWPPESNKIEMTKGPILTLETLDKQYQKIVKMVKKLHSDKLPFIGQLEIKRVSSEFYKWAKGELL